jgi:hypothetical protein
MFVDELTPLVKELTGQPIAFLGGFFCGLFRLNLAEEPVKSWLDQQGISGYSAPPASSNGKAGPQSIAID